MIIRFQSEQRIRILGRTGRTKAIGPSYFKIMLLSWALLYSGLLVQLT